MAGLIEMDGGHFNGTIRWENPVQRIAYLPQLNAIDRHFPITVNECVLLGCWSRVGGFDEISKESITQVREALDIVGLKGFETRALGTLSSGHHEKRTVVAVLHDETQVLLNFPQTLMLARELVDWGPSSQVLTKNNFMKAQAMSEAWDEQAEFCKRNV